MDIQRVRTLTTGILHTCVEDVCKDIEYITDAPGIMTHMIPRAIEALELYLRQYCSDPRFWEGKLDTTHCGEIDIPVMNKEEKEAFFARYGNLPSPLEGNEIIIVRT